MRVEERQLRRKERKAKKKRGTSTNLVVGVDAVVQRNLVELNRPAPGQLNPFADRLRIRRPFLRSNTRSVRLKAADDTVNRSDGRHGVTVIAVEARSLHSRLTGEVGELGGRRGGVVDRTVKGNIRESGQSERHRRKRRHT